MRSDSSPLFSRLASITFVGLFVAFSGFCSLVYQVVWDRTLRYNFGGDSVSSAIVSGTFLLGLGIGAFVFRRWRQNAFAIYPLVEISIGLYAIASYYLLSPLATLLGSIFHYSISQIDGLRAIVVVACVIFLLPPCILMGGTLPLIFNCFIRPGTYQAKTVGLLYGLNTAGAAVGVLAVPFVFLNHVSIPSTLLIVGTGNILLGLAVWVYGHLLPLDTKTSEATQAETERDKVQTQPSLLPVLALGFMSGFISLSCEISLFRAVGLLIPSSPYTFPLVLMPFLLALAVGSILFTRFRFYSTGRALQRVGWLFILAMPGMLAGIIISGASPARFWLLVMPLPFLLGGVFPLLLRVACGQGQELPSRTGLIYLINSIGSFLGALGSQFLGFPLLGTRALVTTLYLLGLATGAMCFDLTAFKSRTRYGSVVAISVLALLPFMMPAAVWDIYTYGHTGPDIERSEGVSGVALVNWGIHPPLGDVEVNGQYMSALPDHPKHVRLARIALSMPRREHLLVLGLGGGGMVRELVRDPAVSTIDVVDWSRELPVALARPRAHQSLDGALTRPQVKLYSCDARVAVNLYPTASFDMVIDNLAVVGWAGSTSLKSPAYFREIRRILKPTGVFVLDPNYLYSPDREAVLAGLLQTFPVVAEHSSAVVVLASALPVQIDPGRATVVMRDFGSMLGLNPPYEEWLLTGFKPIKVEDLQNTPPMRDDLLIYEYPVLGDLRRTPITRTP